MKDVILEIPEEQWENTRGKDSMKVNIIAIICFLVVLICGIYDKDISIIFFSVFLLFLNIAMLIYNINRKRNGF